MSSESIIFFILVLFIWGLSAVARWLKEEMEKSPPIEVEVEPSVWPPSSEIEVAEKGQALVLPVEGRKQVPMARRRVVRERPIVRRLGLGRPETLRRGIILMTVLGPCRALEQQEDLRRF